MVSRLLQYLGCDQLWVSQGLEALTFVGKVL
jgi:hypothetical protein